MSVLFALFVLLYGSMAAPGLDWGDAGEAQLAAWTGGLSHPTGYPLFLMVGWAWTHALARVGVEPTRAMTLFSATAGAAAVAAMVPMMEALLRRARLWLPAGWRLLVCASAAIFWGLSPTFWSQALVAEVYTLHALFLVLLLWGGWADGVERRLPWLALGWGLALGHHRTTLLWLPGLLAWLWLAQRAAFQPRRLLGLAALAALPQLLYLYIAWRGPLTPYLHQPLADGQTLTLYDGSLRAFADHVLGTVFAADLGLRQSVAERLRGVWALARANVPWTLLPYALLGLWRLRASDRWLLGGGLVATVAFGTLYAIGDVEVMFIPAWLALSALIFVGVAALAALAWQMSTLAAQVAKLFLLSFALIAIARPVAAPPTRAGDEAPRTLVAAILAANPPAEAILVTNDRNEMVPLWYAQFAEGQRRDLLGLFPLITPAPEHRSVAAQAEWALRWGRPVFLTKPMPGLALLYDLEPHAAPLVQVRGPATLPTGTVTQGDLAPALRVTAWEPSAPLLSPGETVTVTMALEASAPIAEALSFSVQLFGADGARLMQQDLAPDPFFPSTQWPIGQPLRLALPLPLPPAAPPGPYQVRLSAYALQGDAVAPVGQQVTVGMVRVE